MIDKDTAILLLNIPSSFSNRVLTREQARQISKLIESLSRQAELGEAALKGSKSIETPVCLELEEYEWEYDEDRCDTGCQWMDFCRFAMNWRKL